MISSLNEILILVAALSVDSFVACFIYGADQVKLPPLSALILTAVSSLILLLFLLLGGTADKLLPEGLSELLSFLILFLLGLVKLFDSSVKLLIRRLKEGRRLSLSIFRLHFILTVYADPEKANGEDISILSPKEACLLGMALSLDSAAAGLGAGGFLFSLPLTFLLSLLAGAVSVAAGSFLGNLASGKLPINLSWLSGVLLILLAISKLC